jgi:ubiquitin-conjugating enzyme E2 Z
MSNNPYENEPGFDKANSEDDKKKQAAYVAKIRHETIRIAVIQKLEDIMGVCPNGEYFSTSPSSIPEVIRRSRPCSGLRYMK